MSSASNFNGISRISAGGATVATEIAVRDWLETQARIISYWRDLLVDRNGDLDLIEALDAHEMFLRSASG